MPATFGRTLLLFMLTSALGGLGGVLGSMLGNAAGRVGLFAGGLLGGMALSVVAARIAVARGWIARTQFLGTALGAVLGFLLAASIAVNTLRSPVGPVLSIALIGIGAVWGARYRSEVRGQRSESPPSSAS